MEKFNNFVYTYTIALINNIINDSLQADLYFGSFFLDLPTAMMPFFASTQQRFIITLKNPTDRVIAEYFYPHIRVGCFGFLLLDIG